MCPTDRCAQQALFVLHAPVSFLQASIPARLGSLMVLGSAPASYMIFRSLVCRAHGGQVLRSLRWLQT